MVTVDNVMINMQIKRPLMNDIRVGSIETQVHVNRNVPLQAKRVIRQGSVRVSIRRCLTLYQLKLGASVYHIIKNICKRNLLTKITFVNKFLSHLFGRN